MARPRPIIVPTIGSQIESPINTQIGQSLGASLAALIGRGIQQRREAGQQEAFRKEFESLFPKQVVPAAGPATEEGIEPQAEVTPSNIAALSQLLSQTKEGRQLGQQLGAQQAIPKAPSERKVIKDVEGFQRFVDTGERVFPDVEKPEKEPKSIFGTITDITKFTPESIKKAEESGLRSDLRIKPEELKKTVSGKDKFNAEKDLRKEFTNISKTFRDVRDSFARVQEAGKKPTPAGDLSLIFNFMKMLDPGSVVRESEFANAATAQPILDRLGISFEAVSNVFEGKKLVEEARQDFINQAKKLFNRQNKQHEQRVNEFSRIAKDSGLSVKNVVLNLNDPLFDEEPTIDTLPEGSIQIGTSQGKRVFKTKDGRTFIEE